MLIKEGSAPYGEDTNTRHNQRRRYRASRIRGYIVSSRRRCSGLLRDRNLKVKLGVILEVRERALVKWKFWLIADPQWFNSNSKFLGTSVVRRGRQRKLGARLVPGKYYLTLI